MSKHERFTTAVNDSTGDLIKTKASNQQAYADNWERIFKKPKEDEHSHSDSGVRFTGMMIPGSIAVFEEELLPSGIIGDEV